MSMQITCDERRAIPRRTVLILTCDLPSSFLCRGVQRFDKHGEFTADRAEATVAGWVERQTSAGRVFICPNCVKP